ncbi:hypothetical protein OAN57_00925 [Candidatus Pelagibacter ubique]|nr:hypothetical protein [Candidatus Pelagibacter ubique]MDC0542998.1 hypothetical protein [Candidatus Pelagibacter ubique]
MLLDKPFVDRICKDQIKRFKSAQIDDFELPIPQYYWLQGDPDLLKEKKLIHEFDIASNFFLDVKDIEEQKIKIKKLIYRCLQVESQLNFVLLYPNPDDFKDLRFKTYEKLNDQNLKNFLKYLSKKDPILSKEGLSDEINFENAAVIIQVFSIHVFLNFILQDCIINIGEGTIYETYISLGKEMVKEVENFIPKLNSDGSLNSKEFSTGDKLKTIFNMARENKFIGK